MAHSLFQSVTDLDAGADLLRRRRYGVIEIADGQLRRVLLRPWPKIASMPEILLWGRWYHRYYPGDCVRLYYNQPRRFPNFLAVTYVVSAAGGSFASVCRAQAVLHEIARIKQSDALLCDVGNWRISRKMLARWGWEPHCPSPWHRHYIKRFYGSYPLYGGQRL
ncbi:MAG: hypothetical protein ABSG68_20730 [Thermoguttaceae bacterium]|jgi:hypothetical protein